MTTYLSSSFDLSMLKGKANHCEIFKKRDDIDELREIILIETEDKTMMGDSNTASVISALTGLSFDFKPKKIEIKPGDCMLCIELNSSSKIGYTVYWIDFS